MNIYKGRCKRGGRKRVRGKGSLNSQAVDKKIRVRKALELRTKGLSFGNIAKLLKVSVGAAHSYVSEAVEELNGQIEFEARNLRRVELIRLDKIWRNLEKDFKKTKIKEKRIELKLNEKTKKVEKILSDKYYTQINFSARAGIIDRMLAVMEERRKYIPGLEVPRENKIGLLDEETKSRLTEAKSTLEKKLTLLAGQGSKEASEEVQKAQSEEGSKKEGQTVH